MQSEEQKVLNDFSGEVADAIVQFLEVYPEIYQNALMLIDAEPGPSLDSALMELRTVSAGMAQVLTVFSRTIEDSADSYSRFEVEAQHHPQPVRYLIQEMAECCVLLSGVMEPSELSDLPLLSPGAIEELAERPQTAAWVAANLRATPEPEAVAPAPDPAYAAPSAFDPAQSPYPPTDPSESAAPPPPSPPAPTETPVYQPPAAPAGWDSADPPQGLPDDRRR